MTEVDKLLRQYIERFESGGSADPSDLLSETEGRDRAELSALIEGYLEHAAPAQQWDSETFEGSVAERAVARVAESWSQASGQLPVTLVKLRNTRRITRAELVSRLADSLGVASSREKVASYYHRLERGLLPAERVSSKVWEALANLLETTADTLRQAGSSVAPASRGRPAAFARTAPPPPDEYVREKAADASPGMPSPKREAEEPDEVDVLFTGG